MQKQCHIILYIPDYHVNIHRVCSTFGTGDGRSDSEVYTPVQCYVGLFNYYIYSFT